MTGLLHASVTRQAASRPEATAVVFGEERLTYGQLEKRSNQIARALLNAGCGTGDSVGFMIPKSIDAIISIIGILKAGGIYIPIDVNSPPARSARIIDACEPAVVLTTGSDIEKLQLVLAESTVERPAGGVLDSDGMPDWLSAQSFGMSDIAQLSATPLHTESSPEDVAYILFTSGSTGIPKGVPISHANVFAFVEWANGYFGVDSTDRLSGHTAFHFDLSAYDLFGSLFAGAELHLVTPEATLLPNKTAEFIRQSKLTQWFTVPSVLNYMSKFRVIAQDDFPDLRRVIWCGEVLPTPTLVDWMTKLPHASFTNLYGPTEATIASSYYRMPSIPKSLTETIPIGQACPGESLLILDENLKPVENGVTGDLYIGGVGLSRGYWRDDAKTRTSFIEPEHSGGLGRIYKTGDLAYVGDDGLVYFVGRSDTQIKSRGYRIELGEIETALGTIDALVESAVVAIPSDNFDGKLICCAFVSKEDDRTDAVDVKNQLRLLVPDYMVPARWAQYNSLPKNASGKIDRVQLQKQFSEGSTDGLAAAARS
jgi:amino acid adenylation domain-containing protein